MRSRLFWSTRGSIHAVNSPAVANAGLVPERSVLAMPPEVLRGLKEEYIQSLPADVQREIQHRLRQADTSSRRT